MRRRPPLFALMLAAFVSVIVLGFCGMGTVFVLSTRITQESGGDPFRPPHAVDTPVAIMPSGAANGPGVVEFPAGGPSSTSYTGSRGWSDWRGPLSALLAFAAILLGAATFFSNRVSRPLTRLTRAARTMADGDLSARVGRSAVREIDDLAGAFNSMATSLSDADRQRRQMTADVAHE